MSENSNAEVKQDQVDQSAQDVDAKDVADNKVMGILAYIIFFIPLLAAKESKFAMYHANQGLSLFLVGVGINIVGYVVPLLGWFIVLPLGYLALLALAIMGIVNAANGKMKPLPIIGSWQIIK